MGSWNKTCGLSSLPIHSGEPVVVVLLQENKNHSRCYTNAFWIPVMMPIYAKYNDYGATDSEKGLGLNIVLEDLNKEIGTEMTIKDLYDKVKDGELTAPDYDYRGKKRDAKIDVVMIKESIFNEILDNFKFEKYVGYGFGNTGDGNAYLEYSFADVVADIPAWVERAAQQEFLSPSSFNSLFNVWGGEEQNLAQSFFKYDGGYTNITDLNFRILQALKGDPQEAAALLTETMKMGFINQFMDSARKNWAPGGHEGSQDTDYDAQKFLAGAILKEIDYDFLEREEDAYSPAP